MGGGGEGRDWNGEGEEDEEDSEEEEMSSEQLLEKLQRLEVRVWLSCLRFKVCMDSIFPLTLSPFSLTLLLPLPPPLSLHQELQQLQQTNRDKLSTISQSVESAEVRAALEKNPDISKERSNLLQGEVGQRDTCTCTCISSLAARWGEGGGRDIILSVRWGQM